MEANKPFFVFLGVLTLLTICFGVYVYNLKSCAEQAPLFPIADCQKLYLAFGVLFAVAVMLALGAAFYALVPAPATGDDHPGKQIFDTLSKSLLPVVTLVLGYYFGSAQVAPPANRRGADSADPAASAAATAGASEPQRQGAKGR